MDSTSSSPPAAAEPAGSVAAEIRDSGVFDDDMEKERAAQAFYVSQRKNLTAELQPCQVAALEGVSAVSQQAARGAERCVHCGVCVRSLQTSSALALVVSVVFLL